MGFLDSVFRHEAKVIDKTQELAHDENIENVDTDKKDNRLRSSVFTNKHNDLGLSFKESAKTSVELNAFSKQLVPILKQSNLKGQIIPHKGNLVLYEEVYNQVSYISRIVNLRSSFALQSGFSIEVDTAKDEKIMTDFRNSSNFDHQLYNTFNSTQLWGDCYWELLKQNKVINILNPKFIFVLRNGFIKTGYVQCNNLITSKATTFKPDDLIQFSYNKLADNAYGNSLIGNSVKNIERLLIIEKDIVNILANQASPIVHYKVGTKERPGTQTDVDAAADVINNRLAGEDFVTSNMLEAEVINALPGGFNPTNYIGYYWDRVLGGLIPPVMMGMDEGANKATARVQMDAFEKDIKCLQMQVSTVLEDKVFPLILGKENSARMVWNEMDQEDLLVRDTRIDTLTRAGVPLGTAMKMVGLNKYADIVGERKDDGGKPPADVKNPNRKSFGQGPDDTDTKDE